MESKHAIPRELISGFFSILPINTPVKDIEYDSMYTVLMYAEASKEKTTTAAVGDLASIRRMKQLAREKFRTLPAEGPFPPSELTQIIAEIKHEFD